ncbi:MAG: hypothetical protein LAO56_23380 [Acidobacteriia bacterium]|nr:hypothetical protein [Terriglobia bacterium]
MTNLKDKKEIPRDDWDVITATTGGGTVWRRYRDREIVVTMGDENPQEVAELEHTKTVPQADAPDVLVRNEGTVFVFCPLTSRGKEWLSAHVQSDAMWFGNALVVEHRFAWGLAQGLRDAGLKLE